ncbi:hypothetical protein B0H10DRAFT_2187153 [Mycena sp. CBHHK59/15]|nr:hypothetical protein B0H10DRAFT_2187153 [Mycena sp. CBHHK59/15]
MSRCLFPFDLANTLSSVTKFGHLGPLIAGDSWDGILAELLQSPKTLKKLEDEYSALPALLSPSERLFLKPGYLLNEDEYTDLADLAGWAENPIARYFAQPRFAKPCIRVDQSRMSLTSERRLWRDTYLVKMETRTGYMWTTLCPPFISQSSRMQVVPSGCLDWLTINISRNTKKRLETLHDPLFTPQSTQLHHEYTINYIKTHTKGWTVGPYDFVGHGRSIQYGSSSFIGLCFWHPDLSAGQMLAMKSSWDARSRYPQGMRKLAINQLTAEKNWRNKTKSTITKELGKVAAAAASADYFAREILLRRRKERQEIKRKFRSLLTNGDSKVRSLGPRDSARVRNRSQIDSLAKKWSELAVTTLYTM